jgi:two-component system sensor histidine kinase/response regulator
MLLTYPGLPAEKSHKNLNMILRGGQALRFLVDDLLLKAKSESNKLVLDCKNTDICKLCEAAIADLKEIAARKTVQLIAKTPAPIYRDINIDPMLFRRAIDNLLSNAIKFSPQDSTVTLFVDYIGEQGVRIRVADFGPGVSENLRQSIFEKYEIGTLMKGVSQTGLGLAFCKIVVEAHSGKISVTDNTPQGSIFTIEIDN